MDAKPVLLVEGILIFCHDELVDELDIKVFVVRWSTFSLLATLHLCVLYRLNDSSFCFRFLVRPLPFLSFK